MKAIKYFLKSLSCSNALIFFKIRLKKLSSANAFAFKAVLTSLSSFSRKVTALKAKALANYTTYSTHNQ